MLNKKDEDGNTLLENLVVGFSAVLSAIGLVAIVPAFVAGLLLITKI